MLIETKELITQDTAERQAINLTDQATALVIATNEDRINAEMLLENLSATEKMIFAYLDPPRAKAYVDYQYHKDRLDAAIEPIKQAKKYAKNKCISYDQLQESIRREAQAAAEAAAKKRADDEALAAALYAEQEGDKETAEAILAEPVIVPPVYVPRTAPAPSRLSAGRSTWSAEGINLMETVKAIAEGRAPLEAVCHDLVFLNQQARSYKAGMKIPGCRAVEKKS